MKLNFTGCTDPGLIRSNNQDAYHIDPEGRFFIVADGMGGHAGGEQASRIATQEIQNYLLTNWHSSISASKLLEKALWSANQAILQDQQKHPERADMGTTVVVVVFRSSEPPICGHVGDSRLYRLRESQLVQITEDHTWIARAIKIGDMTADEARVHPYRHVLSRCLGRDDLHQLDLQPLDVKVGDRLLLCSDGLTEELVDQQICIYLQDTSSSDQPNLDKTAFSLVEAAKDEGGHDNITVILIAVEENS
ncbi:serine/threonine-protein phosphatase [Sphaerospermopsis aphanizomenoides BCCUSP55]|uniref:PP2C family protein-serine/threonine phosphatase n=1 Tax=Sphaerospermopsis aphanizomenoides TaxID=459663 RepID=UPI000AFC203B|nr:protein phosphatase 2C domain-containing protein [Sphaerospermopsis aphanizomenoides]MBK1989417.1 serine/threonine-protein phosphatase [Sphaerospermopsis aphanizomenoides BCCUSP55]